ncbi:MAG: hypothetical protein C4524_00020 [Candidatus Zixiibacteriota bacterium]|nr:MAG: hypothetical protein C4524_00020 [candidate division Zixibacteria bacterium]
MAFIPGRVRVILALLFGLFLASSSPASFPVRVEGVPDSLFVGDPIELRLTVSPPGPGQVALPNLGQALEKFDLLAPPDSSAVQQAQGGTITLPLKITSYRGGPQVLQPIQVVWTSADGSVTDSAETEPQIVQIQGLVPDSILALADTTAKPHKLLRPNRLWTLGLSLAEILPWVALVAAAAGLFFLIRWWLRQRRRKAGEIAEELPPPRPAHEVALEELDRLRDAGIFQQGQIKEYYVALSGIIRRYVEERHGIPAMESTSYQLLRDLEPKVTDANLRRVLQNLLEDADLAKFAKHRPDEDDCRRDLERGYTFVRKTTPEAVSPIAAAAPEHNDSGEAA